MSGKQSGKFSTDELRSFYFSKASNYSGFQKVHGTPTQTPSKSAANSSKIAPTPAATPTAGSESTVERATDIRPSAGSALSVVKEAKVASSLPTADSVSPEYITFLRKQQDLGKSHSSIDQKLAEILDTLTHHQEEHAEATATAGGILKEAEASTSWNWKSKFSREALVKDCGLTVPFSELCAEEDIPNVVDLQHQHQQLVKLRQDHCAGEANSAFRLMLENGVRRFDRLIKEFSQSQLDATPVCRLSDNLLVQVDQMLTLEPLTVTLRECNDRIVLLAQKQKECMDIRDQAFDEGEMHIAERETFRLVDLSEELAAAQIEKIHLLEKAAEENTVAAEIRQVYSTKASDDTGKLESNTADLRSRCETDLARLYKLKSEVDQTDQQLDDKWNHERESSDQLLESIAKRRNECWEGIANLIRQLRQLEQDRHAECKRRVEEKIRNETRKIEYRRFCDVAEAHASTLDRTIRNCDTNVHCAKLMAEFLQSGFYTIQKELTEKRQEIDGALLDAHKSHLEIFRSLLFTLSDLEHKRERRIEEVNESIKAAHIQQELCSDSLNPNAKKFSDARKELLRVLDELQLELQDIRSRIQVATDQFTPSERMLVAAKVEHTHPVQEMEDRRLATRVKMVNYKAMSLGNVTTQPLREEMSDLKKSLEESRRIINNSRSASRTGSRLM